jgi:cytochrome c556
MKIGILVFGGVLALATAAAAEVNCKQVNKYLQTGRSVKDVAETMVIGESDVEKCKAQAAATDPNTVKPAEQKPVGGHEGH